MQHECSSPCSQKQFTDPYPQPDESNPHYWTPLPNMPFDICIPYQASQNTVAVYLLANYNHHLSRHLSILRPLARACVTQLRTQLQVFAFQKKQPDFTLVFKNSFAKWFQQTHILKTTYQYYSTSLHSRLTCTRWFKYDRDDLCVNKSQFVPVIFEPPCTCKVVPTF